MSDKETVAGSQEAAYVNQLTWEFDGFHFTCPVPEAVKDRLKDVFDKWKIGWGANKKDGKLSVYVSLKQFRRVQFLPAKIKYTNGATDENLRPS